MTLTERRQRIVALYQSGLEMEEVAAEVGTSRNAVYALLRREGVRLRLRSKRRSAGDAALTPEMLATRRDREPCQWCGVRADVGCAHPRRAPTTSMFARAWG